ncbi:SpoIIE family protein phosphatase [Actinomadura viridis]|uniref:PPM-type phosphatase domain-containing protein n=1 Tax=Actinomadura viridis TaxID=58110 RepID=A0A931GJ66_9ACTN|nr:SpoIIE family protein phosphatase [Actinomadura viridis]MBG6089358.1 hypothetical protein [Actinomadura viridis]
MSMIETGSGTAPSPPAGAGPPSALSPSPLDRARRRLLAGVTGPPDPAAPLTARLRLAGRVLVPAFADLCAIEPAPGRDGAAPPLVLGDTEPGGRPPAGTALDDESAAQSWLARAWREAQPRPGPGAGAGAAAPNGAGSESAADRGSGEPPRLPAAPAGDPWAVAVPLVAGGRLVGTLRLRRAASRPPFDADDTAVVEELARHLGLHLSYALLLGAERAERAGVEAAARRAGRLQRLAAELSGALTTGQVAAVIAAHARSVTDAGALVTVVGMGGAPGAGLRVMACTGPAHERPEPPAGEPGGPPAGLPGVLGATPSAGLDGASPGGPPGGLPAARPLPPALADLLARPRPFWSGPARRAAGVCPACPPSGEPGTTALLPISLLGEPVGALSVVLPARYEPAPAERADLIAIAELGAQALGRARRFDLESRVASTLQRSLLPGRLPRVPGITTRARYRPASQERLGGDWYDQVPVDGGRVAVAVGDVCGHGIGAAAVMSQIRAGLSAYLLEGHPPDRALALASRLTSAFPAEVMVTACCAVVDPAAGTIEYANAGHPPPLVRAPDGEVAFLNAALGPPLGVGGPEVPGTARLALPPGSTLLLYTDGLIERRGESLDLGLARLAERLIGCSGPLDRAADALLALTGSGAQDDVTILLLRTGPDRPNGPNGPGVV